MENSGPPGDLYVCLDIEEPSDIKRDGINLYSTVSVSYIEAILGTIKKVFFSVIFGSFCHSKIVGLLYLSTDAISNTVFD